ncbi:MAG: hypothetical protein LBH22_06145 [Bacteroidales bacterium]|nr:hypothetical protein [Bacteroidales bacterium]
MENYIFYKMLSTFGYGTCDVLSYNVIEIARKLGFTPSVIRTMTHHTISEVSANGNTVILDSDIEVFYLKYNNQDFAGIQDVLNDKYLIHRTDHYGKSVHNKSTDQLVSQLYHNVQVNHTIYQSVDNFDFILKPQETIEFLWKTADKYHHYWPGEETLEDRLLKNVVSNSKFIFSPDFKDTTLLLSEMFNEHEGLSLNEFLKPTTDSAYFIYRTSLPFPILFSTISGIFKLGNSLESIQVFISLDNEQSWSKVWEKKDTNFNTDTFNLSEHLAYPAISQNSIPTYHYSLKFLFCAQELPLLSCGIDSLQIENIFQISKFFIPQLKLGENIIEYTDANGNIPDRNVEVIIEWQESWENKPPNKVTTPTFPLHQANVDSLYFAFTWEPATDDDGDRIVDYEFMLSNDDRMLFPHSPNFNLYTSAFGEGAKPYFKVKETGWLNDGETYYWRVRAKDARGAWGEWSDTWSFTPHGVMRPINAKSELVGQSIKLSWERNPIGKQPDFYKIYASDEMNGFYPDEVTLFALADSTEFIIPFDEKDPPFSFYRISACDSLGQESLISDVIAIPYPFMYAAFDSIRPDSLFRMNLFTNNKFYPYIYYIYIEDLYFPQITIDQKPDWLSYTDKVLYGTDTHIARKLVYLDSTHRTIEISMNDYMGSGIVTQTILLQTVAVNNAPELILSDSITCENNYFSAYITSIDGDVAFGDTNFYTVLQKPTWLNYEINGDTILLFGTPVTESMTGFTFQDSLLRVLAVDTKNDSTTVEYLIGITPRLQILSAISDTAIMNQPFSYSIVVNREDEYSPNLSFSSLSVPKWLETDGFRFFGIPTIYDLSDTILRIAMYDRICNYYVEHEAVIFIQHVNHPPVLVIPILHDALENYPYFAQITAYDIDTLVEEVTFLFTISPDNSWLSIDSTTGVLHGTPLRTNIFVDTAFTITVCDQHGACDSGRIRIHIDWFNSAPELVLIDNPICEDGLYIGFITSVCGDVFVGDTHIYIPLVLPEWIGISIVGDTVFLEGIPTEKDLNDTIVRILAIDRKNEITIEEYAIRLIPKLKIRSASVDTATTNVLYTYAIETSQEFDFSDFSLIQCPAWLNLDENFVFSGIPRIQDLNDTILLFSIEDETCSHLAEQRVSITILYVNHPPVITTTELPDALEENLYVAQIMAYDMNNLTKETLLSYEISPNTSWLSIDAATGRLEGTPLREHIFENTFLVRACNPYEACDSAQFNIYIDWLNRTPELILVDLPKCEDALYTGYITSIDGDVLVGDSHIYIPLAMPEWIDFYVDGDTVFLSGIATEQDLNDTIVRILAIDLKNELVIQDFAIQLIPKLKIHSVPVDTAMVNSLYTYVLETNKHVDFSDFYFAQLPSWLQLDENLNFVGTPQIEHLNDSILHFLINDMECSHTAEQRFSIFIQQGVTIITPIFRNFSIQIIKSESENKYYSIVQTAKQMNFRYRIYSVDGKLVFTSSNQNLTEGIHYLLIETGSLSNGIYIFEGIENNQIRHSIKFIKQ